ncbi:MAG: hypothetical protein KDK64_06045 [Chlamydiia bacterium]|nr:hypothetical protein [Chlamydiia bacterium]
MKSSQKKLTLLTLAYVVCLCPLSLFSRITVQQEREIIGFCVEHHVKQHIEKKLASAQVLTDPFPHIVIEGILPERLYNIASDYWPGFTHFKGAGNRKKIYTTYGCIEKTNIIEEKRVFWRTFGEVVVKHYLKPLITQKFMSYLDWKFPVSSEEELQETIKDLTFYPYHYDCLVTDLPSYEIKPHIDGIKTFIQAIIYFPKDSNHQDLGTVLYKGSPHKRPLSEQKGSAIMEHNGDLVPVKQVAYKPNTLVAFIQSPVSWHSKSVSSHPDQNYLRRSYFLDIRLSPESMQKIYQDETSLAKYYLDDFNTLFSENWERY